MVNRRNLGVQDQEFKDRDRYVQAADKHRAELESWAAEQLRHQCFIDGTRGNVADIDRQLGTPLTAGDLKKLLEKLSPNIKVVRHPYWTNTWTVSVPRRLERAVLDSRSGHFTKEKLQYLCAFDGPVVPEFTVMTTKTQGLPSCQRTDPIVREEEVPWNVQNPGWRSVLAKVVLAGAAPMETVDREASKISIHTRESWQALMGKSDRARVHM